MPRLAAFALLFAVGCAKPAPPAGPVVRVNASYPGASAEDVDATVVAPLVQQILGIENAVRIDSEARAGVARVVVRFKPGADPDVSAVLVQNRAALAEPALPEEVRRRGVTIHKGDPDDLPTYWFTVRGKAGAAGPIARAVVRDRVTTLPGVSDAQVYGDTVAAARVWVDPDRLAARALTTSDVSQALRAAGLRAADAERVADVILAERAGHAVRLRDVATVEWAERPNGFARVGGDPAVVVAVSQTRGEPTPAAIQRFLDDLTAWLPAGVEVRLAADLTDPAGHAWVELRTPDPGAVVKAADAARGAPGGPRVVAVHEAGSPTAALLVRYGPGAKPDLAALRNRVGARVLDLSGGPTRRFPVEAALCGPEPAELKQWADAVRAANAKGPVVADLVASGADGEPGVSIDVDRAKAKELGVPLDTITEALATEPVGVTVGGTTVEVRLNQPAATPAEAVRAGRVRAADGKLVPLAAVVRVREGRTSSVVHRVGTEPAVVLSANPTAGDSADKLRGLAERARAELKLPEGYRFINLR